MKTLLLLLIGFSLSAQVSNLKLNTPKWFDDKAAHFYVAAGTTYIVSEIVWQTTDLDGLSPLVGTAAGLVITWSKEIVWDGMMNRGVKSLSDGIHGTGGSFTGGLVHRVRIDIYDRKQERELLKLERSKHLLD